MDVSDFSREKVLVTGASGFIGSHLTGRLLMSGREVHALSRQKRASDGYGPRWWQGDLAEAEAVRDLLATIRPSLIFHLASHVAGARYLDLVLPTFRSTLMSTVNLLTAASKIGCRRIVVTGSMEEPDIGNPQATPSSPYAVAKWAGCAYARMFHALYQLPVVILRVFMVYGPGQQDLRKVIPYVILSLLRGESPKLTNGHRQVDWVYVEDVVEGFLSAARAPAVEGSTIDIGSGDLVSIRAVVERLARLIDPESKPLFGALADRPFEEVRVADTARSIALIGWKAATSLEEGLGRTVDWYARRFKEGTLGRSSSLTSDRA